MRPRVVSVRPKPQSDGFAVAICLAMLFPPLGVIATFVYLFAGKPGRALAVLLISIAAAMFMYAVWLRLGGTIIIW